MFHSVLAKKDIAEVGKVGKKWLVWILYLSIYDFYRSCAYFKWYSFGVFFFWLIHRFCSSPKRPDQAYFPLWATLHPQASSLPLPGSCTGGAKRRTQSNWRTSWHSAKRNCGGSKENQVYWWKSSTSLAASVTLIWPCRSATVSIQTGVKCWTLLLLETRAHEWLNSRISTKKKAQQEELWCLTAISLCEDATATGCQLLLKPVVRNVSTLRLKGWTKQDVKFWS